MKPQVIFQPAERNPVAIRRTVIFLILLMLLGGFFIVYKYKQKMGEEHVERQKGRPVMSLGSVSAKTNIKVMSVEGEIKDFTLLEGKLTLMTVISAKLPEQSKLIVNEMIKAKEYFSDREKLQLVCISADTLAKVPREELAEFAKEIGATGEGWQVLASNSDEFGGYVKNVLKLGMISRVNKETNERMLPDFLRIVDPSMKIRGEIDDYKFIFYHEIEKATKRELKENPSLLENEQVQKNLQRYQDAVSFNRDKMLMNIDYIITYENTDVAAFKEVNRSNRYHFPLIIFSGFILFILIMGYRLKIHRKKETAVITKSTPK